MVTWTIYKNHLLEVGLNQIWDTMALQNLTTVDLLYYIMCEDPAWIETHWNNIWFRAWSHTLYPPKYYACGNQSARGIKEVCSVNMDAWNYEITQNPHYNNDNVTHVSEWFECFGGLL